MKVYAVMVTYDYGEGWEHETRLVGIYSTWEKAANEKLRRDALGEILAKNEDTFTYHWIEEKEVL